VAPSEGEALYWFRRAAARGHAPAQRLLGLAYLAGHGLPSDAQGARAWLECAAEQGDPEAQFSLAQLLGAADAEALAGAGAGEGQNTGENAGPRWSGPALAWTLAAAEQGHVLAQVNLGNRYAFGRGVARDPQQALYWYRRAAEQGAAKAQFTLGVMYANGQEVRRDEAQAAEWYRRAAEQGDASAQNNLGVMYANGQGVPQDDAQAVHWYRLAAEQGHALAQYNLGGMYNSGRGVARDTVRSYMWMLLAADAGDPAASANKAIVARRLSQEQIANADDMRRRWRNARSYAGPERRAA
jgi:TPR repeat protein